MTIFIKLFSDRESDYSDKYEKNCYDFKKEKLNESQNSKEK
jgi:hypothetical protein